MTPEQIKLAKSEIDASSQYQLASIWRFAPTSHPWFSEPEVSEHFKNVFAAKGGMTPAISKSLGWGR